MKAVFVGNAVIGQCSNLAGNILCGCFADHRVVNHRVAIISVIAPLLVFTVEQAIGFLWPPAARRIGVDKLVGGGPVSYTHLTLPTSDLV